MIPPRENRATWEETYFEIAEVVAKRSPDPNTQVGAVLVDKDNRLLSIGYNAFPRGISQNKFNWARDNKDQLNNKYVYVCHAELAAILNLAHPKEASGGSCFVTMHPCSECMKALIQIGIYQIHFIDAPYYDTSDNQAARDMLASVGGHLWDRDGVDQIYG